LKPHFKITTRAKWTRAVVQAVEHQALSSNLNPNQKKKNESHILSNNLIVKKIVEKHEVIQAQNCKSLVIAFCDLCISFTTLKILKSLCTNNVMPITAMVVPRIFPPMNIRHNLCTPPERRFKISHTLQEEN
jgi:hypothetical protein